MPNRATDEDNTHTPQGSTHTTPPHDQHINHHTPDLTTTTPPTPTTTQYTTAGYTSLPLPTLSPSDIRVLPPSLSIIGNTNRCCDNMLFNSHLESPFNPHLPDPHVNISQTRKETHMQQEAIRNTETATLSIGKPHRNPI
jgi:hypothetical protein